MKPLMYAALALGISLGLFDVLGCTAGDEALFGGSGQPRADYCSADSPTCPDAQFCNLVQNGCEPGACSEVDQVGCAGAEAPRCLRGNCLPCETDGDCAAWTKSYGRGTAREVCDHGSCRPCQQNSECASGVCRTAELTTNNGAELGACVPSSELAYVHNGAGGSPCNARTGQREQPFCEVADAIAAGRGFLVLLPSIRAYAAVKANSPLLLIGPGRDAEPTATLTGLQVTDGGDVLAKDLHVEAPPQAVAAQCEGGRLTLRRVVVRSADDTQRAARGIAGSGCAQLTVEDSLLDGFSGTALLVERGPYRLINLAVTRSGNTQEPFGVTLGSGTGGAFLFNTIVGNARGVQCQSGNVLAGSIVSDNFGMVSEQVQGGCQLFQVPTMVFGFTAMEKATVTPSSLRLQRAVPSHVACCIDQVDLPLLGTDVPHDFFNGPRPRGARADVGFHEAD